MGKTEEYLVSGICLRNSGMLCVDGHTILKLLEKYCSEVLSTYQLRVQSSKVAKGSTFSAVTIYFNTLVLF